MGGRIHQRCVAGAAAELSLGDPMLGISLPDLHSRLSAIGWIEQVAVERRMPTTIRIVLNERIPMALLQTVNGHRVIDSSGTIIAGADPAAFAHLTVVAGTEAADNAAPILDILKTEPELFGRRLGCDLSVRAALGCASSQRHPRAAARDRPAHSMGPACTDRSQQADHQPRSGRHRHAGSRPDDC